MRYTLKRDDMPLLSQWIKKFDKPKLVEFFWQGRKDLNPRPMVLETSTLPTELHPYKHWYYTRFYEVCQDVWKIFSQIFLRISSFKTPFCIFSLFISAFSLQKLRFRLIGIFTFYVCSLLVVFYGFHYFGRGFSRSFFEYL